MRRKKDLLIYSLVLGGVVLPSLASCEPEEGQQSENTQFVIEVGEYDENAGKVSLTNTSGDINIISEVDVTIIAFEGYKVTSIKFNGTALDANTLSFKVRPTKGTNTLDVVFEEDTLEELTEEMARQIEQQRLFCWKNKEALDAHHKTEMMKEIAKLREKYHLHMKVEQFVEK